ncbi:MAG: RNA degradosome polyphosphate kinase, partial [Pseudomonadota bacterium]
ARVISIVGRFLEHSRIYYFRNGGDEEFFIGSADLMNRNLESRVEVLAPIRDAALQSQLRVFLDQQVNDRCGAWEMDADGAYQRRTPGEDDQHSQLSMLQNTRESSAIDD